MALIEKLTAIADAIRSKTGKTNGLTLDAMPGEIEGIETGGGGDTSIEDGLITRTLTSYSNDRITTVGDRAFQDITAMAEISLPNATQISKYAFHGCTNLKEVSIPNVTTVGNYAFGSCGFSKICFPFLDKPGEHAFAYSELESVTNEDLPSLTALGGNYVFRECKKLKYFQHNAKRGYEQRTFFNSTALEKVDIHATNIAYHDFSGCSALATLILRRTDAICTWSSANGLDNTPIKNGTGYVYVPSALLEEYKLATNWSSLSPEQFRAIEDYPEICEVGV